MENNFEVYYIMSITITLRRINNVIVKPIPIKIDTRKIKGDSVCTDCYCNILLVAATNSGKTTALNRLLKECVGKDTCIVAFVSTLYNDEKWNYIRRSFEKKGVEFLGYNSIFEEGENQLKEIVHELEVKAKEREEEEDKNEKEEEPVDLIKLLRTAQGFQDYMEKEEDEEEKKKKKSKYQCPDYLFIFDDLSGEIKTPYYEALVKKARNYKIKTITSTQYLKDVKPETRFQMRLWLIFGGLSDVLVESVHTSMGLKMPFYIFLELYKRATEKTEEYPCPFFYVCPVHSDFRINFDIKFDIPEEYL